jgi:flagella basal body P-ring formation protein FlgA
MLRLCLFTASLFCNFGCALLAAELVGLRFRDQPVVEGQVVRVGDMLEIISGLDQQMEDLLKLPLAPAPREGVHQTWTRADVIQHLELRGLHSNNIRWHGAEQVVVRHGKPVASSTNSIPGQLASRSNSSIPGREFSPAFVQERSVKQAEMLLSQAITEYVTLKSGDRTEWRIELTVPMQFVHVMQIKNNIVSISGGHSPWEGTQEFVFEVKDRGALIQVPIKASLKLPPMVVSSTRPIRKDEVITADALTYSPLPKRSAASSAEYFTDIDALVGKQLRRSVSTGLAIEADFVGEPIVISRGELVEVESIAGSVVVRTSGRAVESGSVGQLIGVELLPARKKVLATVSGPLKVRIAAVASRSEG